MVCVTEIKVEKIEIRREVFRFCAIDNHVKKKGRTYDIIYKARTSGPVTRFMIEKGIWE